MNGQSFLAAETDVALVTFRSVGLVLLPGVVGLAGGNDTDHEIGAAQRRPASGAHSASVVHAGDALPHSFFV
jgi:hypothetical protein